MFKNNDIIINIINIETNTFFFVCEQIVIIFNKKQIVVSINAD